MILLVAKSLNTWQHRQILTKFWIPYAHMYIFSKIFQLICTGTFYEEWIEEDKRFPLPIYLNMICIVLHFTMIFLIFKSGRKVNTAPVNQMFQKNATAINFGSIPISWLIFLLCASGLILGRKMYRYFINW